jgi:hypothetical protein
MAAKSLCSKVCQSGPAAKLEQFCADPDAYCNTLGTFEKYGCKMIAGFEKADKFLCANMTDSQTCETKCTEELQTLCSDAITHVKGCSQNDKCVTGMCNYLMPK